MVKVMDELRGLPTNDRFKNETKPADRQTRDRATSEATLLQVCNAHTEPYTYGPYAEPYMEPYMEGAVYVN